MHAITSLTLIGCKFWNSVVFTRWGVGVREWTYLSSIRIVTVLHSWWICSVEWPSLCVTPCDPFIKHLAVLNSEMDSNCFTAG